MRVTHLNDRISARGGADQHLLAVLARQVDRAYDVQLVASVDDKSAVAPCPASLVPGLDARNETPITLPTGGLSDDPGLIHVHNVMNPVAIALADIVTVQDHRAFCPGRGKLTADDQRCTTPMDESVCSGCFEGSPEYFRRIMSATAQRLAALKTVPRITVLSEYMASELKAVGLERVVVIPPFVHDLPQAAPIGPAAVLFVGRVVDAKGVRDAIEAWKRSGVDLPLVMVGTGRERSRLEAQGITVTGWLNRSELAGQYARAAAVIMPSRWQEPFGIVGLEALSRGVPVVAWDSGGVAEWHPGPLAAWGDVDALAQQLRLAVQSTPSPPSADFSPAPLMDRLEAVYQDVLHERGD
jgi:glycosyltransferase involved in cell wall biosynthesis